MAGRVAAYNRAAAAISKPWFDAKGNWIRYANPLVPRERYWLCCSLFAAGEDKFANTIIEGTQIKPWDGAEWKSPPSTFDIFHTNIACFLLAKYDKKLTPAARKPLVALAKEGMQIYHGDRRPDFQFHGYNDNMPAEATMGLILGGEYLGDKVGVEHGVWNLRRFRDILRRRGNISEWNSPTYTPVTLHAMAEIAEYAENAEARELAAKIEERLWLDVAARFHPEIGAVAGPYARAYSVDELAYVSNYSSMLWFALGDISRVSPMELMGPNVHEYVLHHEGEQSFNIAQMCWFSAETYHVPEKARQMFFKKTYPFRAITTAEMGDGGPEFPARSNRLETVLYRDFAVGTAASQWISAGGHPQCYMVLYKRTEKPVSRKDTGVVYHKILINDDIPGMPLCTLDPEGQPYPEGGEKFLGTNANVLTMQDGPTALVLTNPKQALGGQEDRVKATPLTKINDMVIFPSHFGGADEIYVGDESRPKWGGGVRHGEWIGCRRGRMLIAVRPLTFLAPGEKAPRLSLEKINNYEVIKTELYNGESKVFKPQELRTMFAGFVAEHASVDEYPSLEAFVKEMSKAKFTDYYWIMRRTRYRRPATSKRAALEMEISFSPGAPVSRYAVINGNQVEETRLQIDGLTDKDYPIINEPFKPIPGHFPWPHFNSPWGIGSVGDKEEK